jgi:hypothetical protein
VPDQPLDYDLLPVEADPFADPLAGATSQGLPQSAVDKLAQTWPAKLAKQTWSAVTLPGDVAQGNVDPLSDEAVARSADLAALATGSSFAAPAERDAAGMGIRAFHGSPHDFEQFDLSKIGTGEGAQAYGHGLYFAENPQTAQAYRDALEQAKGPKAYANTLLTQADGDFDKAIAMARSPEQRTTSAGRTYGEDAIAHLEALKSGVTPPGTGKMYEVAINADPEHFLDWDKPLSEQSPKVQEALQSLGYDTSVPRATNKQLYENARRYFNGSQVSSDAAEDIGIRQLLKKAYDAFQQGPDIYADYIKSADDGYVKSRLMGAYRGEGSKSGASFYGDMKMEKTRGGIGYQESPKEATEVLREAGIPGIKYLDQGSRPTQASLAERDALLKRIAVEESTLNAMQKNADAPSVRAAFSQDEIASQIAKQQDFISDLKSKITSAPKPTSNYVVFNDRLINIIKKYGLAGLVAGGAAHFKVPTNWEQGMASGGRVMRYADGGDIDDVGANEFPAPHGVPQLTVHPQPTPTDEANRPYDLQEIDHDPFAPTLASEAPITLESLPAATATVSKIPSAVGVVAKGAAEGIYSAVAAPGDVVARKFDIAPSGPPDAQGKPTWSEEDQARLNMANATVANRAADLAGIAMTGGLPMAEEGALGMAGGKLKTVNGPVETTPGYVYHATNEERAADIAEQGLKLHKPRDFTDQDVWPDGSTDRRNYFTPTASNAWQFAPEEGRPVLLRIPADTHPFRKESTGDIYSNKVVPPSKIEALTEDGWRPIKEEPEAPASPQEQIAPRFYSAVENAVTNAKTNSAPANQWLGMLRNAPGVKPEELDWLGVNDWLADQKGNVSKQDLADYIRGNKVDVQEVEKGAPDKQEITRIDSEIRQLSHWPENPGLARDPENQARLDNLNRQWEAASTGYGQTPKFAQYTLPGGENYRELLLTLPTRDRPATEEMKSTGAWLSYTNNKIGDYLRENPTAVPARDAELARLAMERDRLATKLAALRGALGKESFRSSHWDEPNVLAHVRFDDRNIGGDRTLHISEVQSDWHQKGRKEGYQTGEDLATLKQRRDDAGQVLSKAESDLFQAVRPHVSNNDLARDLVQSIDRSAGLNDLNNPRRYQEWLSGFEPQDRPAIGRFAIARMAYERAVGEFEGTKFGVPDAPFKNTWPELALKRMIRKAADEGYDRISWDTGATNADRYDLSKQINELRAIRSEGTDGPYYTLDAKLKGRDERTRVAENVPEKELADHVGKEMAEKIVKDIAGQQNNWGVKNRVSGNWSPRFTSKEEAVAYQNSLPKSVRDKTDVLAMASKHAAEYSGLDLKVGGEGMRGFYDQILPAAANKLVKKYGAKVEQSGLRAHNEDKWYAVHSGPNQWRIYDPVTEDYAHGWGNSTFPDRESASIAIVKARGKETPIHSIKITPELRKAALTQGFPLFKHGGRVTRAVGGAIPCGNGEPEHQELADWRNQRPLLTIGENDPVGTTRRKNAPQSDDDVIERASGGRVLQRGLTVEYAYPLNRWGVFDKSGAMLSTGKTKDDAIEALISHRADGGAVPESQPIEQWRPSTNVEDARNETPLDKLEQNFMLNVSGQRDNWISDLSNVIRGQPTVSQRERMQRAHGGRVDPKNIDPNPTEAQKHAGNYKKDRIHARGMEIMIENAAGSTRSGIDKNGKPWSVKMPKNAHYGYIRGVTAKDKDPLDCFVGPHRLAPHVFIVDQIDADSGKYDEGKCLLFFANERQARRAYEASFSDGRGKDRIGKITGVTLGEFRDWLDHGNVKKPFEHVRSRQERVQDILKRHGVFRGGNELSKNLQSLDAKS